MISLSSLTTEFWEYLVVGWAFVVTQGIAAFRDGYLTQRQMRYRVPQRGYSLMEHGGMWADVLLISPITAYILSIKEERQLHFGSVTCLIMLGIIVVTFAVLGAGYAKASKKTPEAHAHHGRTTPAGWIHGLYAVISAWVSAVYYFTAVLPLNCMEMGCITLPLLFFFPLGAVKFNQNYIQDRYAMIQSLVGPFLLGAISLYRTLGYEFFK